MMQRIRLLMAALATALLHGPLVAAESRPNIIVLLVDDFGWADPSCYGNKSIRTPNIDRLAAEGIRFTQGYVAAPICSPSRCGIITGQFPARWRITSYLQTKAGNQACGMADFLDPKAPSLPRILKGAGYAAAHIGKWHLGGGRDVTEAPKFANYGYDVGLGTYESPEPAAPLGLKTRPWDSPKTLEPQQVSRHRRTEWMVDQTIAFIRKHRDRPCFVNLWLDDTHTPFVPSDEQMKTVAQKDEPELRTKYRAVLADMDRHIGRLREALAGTDTLVILLGDNGPSPPFERERTGGLRGQKLSLYEGGIRVPMISWWPTKIKSGSVNDRTVFSSVDFVPTLARLAGAKLSPDDRPDGEDMSEAVLGKTPVRTRPLLWEYGRNNTSFAYPKSETHRSPNVAVRDGSWKLLVNADGSQVELYDLTADRAEAVNRAAEQKEWVDRLKRVALDWRKSLP